MAVLFIFFIGLVGVMTFFYFVPIRLWIAATFSGAGVGMGQLVAMRLRRVTPAAIIDPRIAAVKAGLDVPVDELEAHYLAGGNVEHVVRALISADKAGIHLTFARAAAIDLAGRDVLEAVRMSVNPKVILSALARRTLSPSSTSKEIPAMTGDGLVRELEVAAALFQDG